MIGLNQTLSALARFGKTVTSALLSKSIGGKNKQGVLEDASNT